MGSHLWKQHCAAVVIIADFDKHIDQFGVISTSVLLFRSSELENAFIVSMSNVGSRSQGGHEQDFVPVLVFVSLLVM